MKKEEQSDVDPIIKDIKEQLDKALKLLQSNLGGNNSAAFLKCPQDFLKQITACVEFFAFRAHQKLMVKLKDPSMLINMFSHYDETIKGEIDNLKEHY